MSFKIIAVPESEIRKTGHVFPVVIAQTQIHIWEYFFPREFLYIPETGVSGALSTKRIHTGARINTRSISFPNKI